MVRLSTLGAPLTVSLEPSATTSGQSSSGQLTVDEVITMQLGAGLTDRQLFQILKDLRAKFGRKCIESHLKETLIKRKTVFSDLFSKEIVTFEDSKGCPLFRPFVFCHDLDEFIDRILFLRDDENLNNEDKLGFDDGKGILKPTLSMYDPCS